MRYLALLVLLASWPAICQMNTGCPWLNVATATGVLQSAESSPMATLAEGGKPACDFTYHDATASRELKITVEEVQDAQQAMTAYQARCGSSARPLRAIGNEAVTCAVDSKGKSYGQQVIGVVRDQIFTVADDHQRQRTIQPCRGMRWKRNPETYRSRWRGLSSKFPRLRVPTPPAWLDAINGTWCSFRILCRWDSSPTQTAFPTGRENKSTSAPHSVRQISPCVRPEAALL